MTAITPSDLREQLEKIIENQNPYIDYKTDFFEVGSDELQEMLTAAYKLGLQAAKDGITEIAKPAVTAEYE